MGEKKQGSPFKVEESSLDADGIRGQRTMKLMGDFQLSPVGFGSCPKWVNNSYTTKTKRGPSIGTCVERGGHAHGSQMSACDH